MSKPFDYSKWDKIELSDDEEDVHPNIDKDSWFRMKHRSRVEREEKEEEDKKKINTEMSKANQRINELEFNLRKISTEKAAGGDSSDSDDEDLDDTEGLKAELEELKKANAARQAKLDEYEKNKTWNVDNICHVAEERTLINPKAGDKKYTSSGFALPDDAQPAAEITGDSKPAAKPSIAAPAAASSEKPSAAAKASAPAGSSEPAQKAADKKTTAEKAGPEMETGAMLTYPEFTDKYADLVEEFMAIKDLEKCKQFLLIHGDVMLQENAANYLLLASLEDEMNGFRDKMRQTARQSQIISNIAELAKSLNSHPGNVIVPFFERLKQKEFLDGFNEGVEGFVQKIIARAVTKKIEMEREQAGEQEAGTEGVDLADIPREERLGPGGLDPLEVVETLPESMQKAFESRDVEELKKALMAMDPAEAEHHMKRCVDSGLWTQ